MPVRLACFRHAASVYPEPGSNSPSKPTDAVCTAIDGPIDKGSPSLLTTLRLFRSLTALPRPTTPHRICIRAAPRLDRIPHPSSHRQELIGMRRPPGAGGEEASAAAYCPGQLPAEYRGRWGVSRPCSGWERVGPPRPRHQGHRRPKPPEVPLAVRADVSRSCRPGVVPGRMMLSPRPLVPLRCTPRGASTRGLSTRSSTWGLTRLTRWGLSSPGELPA